MNVVTFPLNLSGGAKGGWRSTEVQQLTGACAAYISSGQASGWVIGETECGDPQLYILGPSPEEDCILTVSRLGRLYIVEDGNGQMIFEHDNVLLIAERIATALRNKREAFLGQIALAWLSIREFYEEKVEPALAEPVEVVSHFALQFGVFV
jgi:hypothetical protein